MEMRLSDAAAVLGTSRATAFRWLKAGRLQATRRGWVTAASVESCRGSDKRTVEFWRRFKRSARGREAAALWPELAGRDDVPPPAAFVAFAMSHSAGTLALVRSYVVACRARVDQAPSGVRAALSRIRSAFAKHGSPDHRVRAAILSAPRGEAIAHGASLGIESDDVKRAAAVLASFAARLPVAGMARVLGCSRAAAKLRIARARRRVPLGWDFRALLSRAHALHLKLSTLPAGDDFEPRANWFIRYWLLEPARWRASTENTDALARSRDDADTDDMGFDDRGELRYRRKAPDNY